MKKVIGKIVYGTEENVNSGDLYLPDRLTSKTPLALTIHGGGWCSMDRFSFAGVAEFLCENGFAVYNIEYRLTNAAPWPACGDDCLKAAAFLNDPASIADLSHIQDRRITVIGASSGGHLALMTGLRFPDCRSIISISGVNSPEGYLKCFPDGCNAFFAHKPPFSKEEIQNAFPAGHLKENNAPILLTHALFDNVADIQSSLTFENEVRKSLHPIRTYYYNRKNDGHCIWVPNSSPHKLHPDIEYEILRFLHDVNHLGIEEAGSFGILLKGKD